MRVVFLDIDGVLNNDRSIKEQGTNLRPDASNVAQLNRLVRACDARVVISSNWREGKPLWMVQYIMGHHLGIEGPVIGMTPDFKATKGLAEDRHQLRVRGLEISQWLVDNPWTTSYVVIDDRQVIGHDRFLKTDPAEGLTQKIADAAIVMLTTG